MRAPFPVFERANLTNIPHLNALSLGGNHSHPLRSSG